MTPFKALYGREPPKLTRYQWNSNDQVELQDALHQRDLIIDKLKKNLNRAQQVMKAQADRKRRDISFSIGDKVLVKLQPCRQTSVAQRKNQKLGMKYFGPFPIIAKVGEVAYRLQLPDFARIHPVFHISQLKLFKGDSSVQYVPLPLTTSDLGPIMEPERILQTRTIKKGGQWIPQVLIKWKDLENAEATWEHLSTIQQSYPTFNLGDKVVVKGEGIGMRSSNNNDSVEAESENNADNARGEGQLVKEEHVANDAEIKEIRRSSRKRVTNSRWRDFV